MPSHPPRGVENDIPFVPLGCKEGGAAHAAPHSPNGSELSFSSSVDTHRTRSPSPLSEAVTGPRTEASNSPCDLGTAKREDHKGARGPTPWKYERWESKAPRPAADGGEEDDIRWGRAAGGNEARGGEPARGEEGAVPRQGIFGVFPASVRSAEREASPSPPLAGKRAGTALLGGVPHRAQSVSPTSLDERAIPTLSPLLTRLPPARSMPSPHHWSVFYPEGIDSQPPLLLHYLSLGGWRTVAGGWDYFSHRRLQDGEVTGHDVRWLHSARPRDRFVFIITPVEPKADDESVGRWHKFRDQIYGPPPAFAYTRGKLFKRPPFGPAESVLSTSGEGASLLGPLSRSEEVSAPIHALFPWNADGRAQRPSKSHVGRGEKQRGHRPSATTTSNSINNNSIGSGGGGKATVAGVEAIEVRHEDITATDYSPRLSSSRFAIESKAVYAYYFSTLEDALTYYDCLDDLYRMEEQTLRGVTNRLPCHPRRDQYKISQSLSSVVIENECRGDSVLQATMATTPTTTPQMSVVGTGKEPPMPARKEVMTELLDLTIMDRSGVSSDGQMGMCPPWNEGHVSYSSSSESLRFSESMRRLRQQHQYDHSIRQSVPANPATVCAYGTCGELHHANHRDAMTPVASQRSPVRDRAPAIEPSIRPRLLPTLTTAHFDTIITVYSEDPNFNAVLREVLMPEPGTHPYTVSLKEQRRMLSMYETGMPAWTIFLASTGLPYRRVFRLIFVGLVNIWPLISLFVGLYDLYKHLPRMKTFVTTTLAPLLEWVEQHVTFRLSMLTTYIISVGVTVAASFTSFLSQFYLLELLLSPLRILGGLLQTPFALVFELLWSVIFIIGSFLRLLLVTLKMIFAGPFLLVTHLSSWEFTSTPVLPAAVEGTSLTMKWWRAWQEFWVTVASPVKNLAKAWYDSVVHVAVSAARREASIRRWYTPRLRYALEFVAKVREVCAVNLAIWWQLCGPGWGLWLLYGVLCAYVVYLLLAGERGGLLAALGVGPAAVSGEGGGGGGFFVAPAPVATAAEGGGPRGGEHVRDLAGTAAASGEGGGSRASPPPPPAGGGLALESGNDNGFDALFFAWETLIAVWLQLPW